MYVKVQFIDCDCVRIELFVRWSDHVILMVVNRDLNMKKCTLEKAVVW